MARVWQIINEITEQSKTVKSYPTSLMHGHTKITNAKDFPSTFNNFFIGVAKQLAGNYQGMCTVKNIQEQKLDCFEDTSPAVISSLLSQMPPKLSAGPDGIPVKVLHFLREELSIPLAHVINLSLQQGTVPDCLKVAKVIVLHKGGSQNDVNNYRPISLLPSISKLLEKVVYKQLSLHMGSLLTEAQFGFRPGRSTLQAAMIVVNNISKACCKKESSANIFIDFQKAFDTVDHELLL
jgi:hypothetical protein